MEKHECCEDALKNGYEICFCDCHALTFARALTDVEENALTEAQEEKLRRVNRLGELQHVLRRRFNIDKTLEEINDFVGDAW